MPKLTQHEVESEGRSPGLLTPGSVLRPTQLARARFPRALSPLSGVELIRAPHICTFFSCSMAESPSWSALDSKQNVAGRPETLSVVWGTGGAVGEKRAARPGCGTLHITDGEKVTGSSLLPCHPNAPSQGTG